MINNILKENNMENEFKVNAVFFTYEKDSYKDKGCNIRYTRKHIGYYTERLARNSNIERIVHAIQLPDNEFKSKFEVLSYLNAHEDHLNAPTDTIYSIVKTAVFLAHHRLSLQRQKLAKQNALRGTV